MIALPHHVEFLSEAWRDQAPRFLVGEAGGAPMVDTLEGGSWHAAVLPRPSGFSDVSLDELSCAASSDALSCVAVGFADEGTGQLEAILDLRTIAGGTAAPPA